MSLDVISTTFGEIHHRLVEHYAPPSVLVNAELEIVHASEHAHRYTAANERALLVAVHPALRLDTITAVYEARAARLRTASRVVRYRDGNRTRTVGVRARAVDLPGAAGMMLILFDEFPPDLSEADGETELERMRAQLSAAIQHYESVLEALTLSNEELQITNTELRASTEQLEMHRRQLQDADHARQKEVVALARANANLENLMSATDVGAVFVDRDLRITLFTPRARDGFNITARDVGRSLEEITTRFELADACPLAREVLQTREPVERPVTMRDGRMFLFRVLPYVTVERIDGVVLTLVDVSELRLTEARLRATEQRFRLALRAAPMFAMHQDAQLHYTWRYMFGRELAPGDYPALFDDDVDDVRREVMASRTGRRIELAVPIDDLVREFDVYIDPILDGDRVVGVTTVGFDISVAKAAEALLRDIDRKKDEFLATLSHELRNPLTPLRVALDLQRAVTDPAQLELTRQVMDRQLTQLTHLVDELLDVSRITTGRIQLVPTSFATRDALDAAIEATRPLFDAACHHLAIEMTGAPDQLRADYARVTQILTNLLSNAAKYTPHGGHVELVVEQQDRLVRFTVRDDGIGIAPGSLPCVFDLFAECRDDSGRSKPGLGVGLNLVKRLVELHGGTVAAHSGGVGRGSEFVVELPIEAR